MSAERLDRLTDRQKQCLRFVAQGLEVKEIARTLELSPSAVVERLRAARRLLDVETSREAARMLAELEATETNIRHVDTPPRLADIPYPLPPIGASDNRNGPGDGAWLREAAAPFEALVPSIAIRPRKWPVPWRGEGARCNDLTSPERLLASGGLTIAIALGAAVLLIAVVQLMTFLIELSRHGG